ncbi:MAG: hypothetical protein MJ053_00780 [Elusimicrobiaceae bacterium]|nr:hypothetical protein [Elusimicrobiaceae bacterium]
MRKCIALLLALILTTGCMSFRSGSLPHIPKEDLKVDKDYKKRDVSFSVSYYQQVGDDIIISQKQLQKTIKDSFKKSQLFNRVYSTTFAAKSDYHYHFDLKLTGTSYEDQQATGLVAGYLLLTIPVWMNFYLDITMYLFVDGKEVYSVTTSDRVTDLIWLPLAVTWIFANHATMGAHIRKHSLKYFISEIKRNKLYAIPTADHSVQARPNNLKFLDEDNSQNEEIENDTDTASSEELL